MWDEPAFSPWIQCGSSCSSLWPSVTLWSVLGWCLSLCLPTQSLLSIPFPLSWLLDCYFTIPPPPMKVIKSLCWALEFEHCIVFCEFDMMCLRRWWETLMGDVQQGRSSELRSVEMMPTERIIDFLVYSTYPPCLERGRDLRICTGEWSNVLYFFPVSVGLHDSSGWNFYWIIFLFFCKISPNFTQDVRSWWINSICNGDIKTLHHLMLRDTEWSFPDALPLLKVDRPAGRASAAFDVCNYG